MAPPGCLDQLTLALGLLFGRRPLRGRCPRLIGFGPDVLGYLMGDPNEVGCALAVLGTGRIRFDALKKRPGLVGTEIDFMQASEQFKALEHGAPLHRHRDERFECRLGSLV